MPDSTSLLKMTLRSATHLAKSGLEICCNEALGSMLLEARIYLEKRPEDILDGAVISIRVR